VRRRALHRDGPRRARAGGARDRDHGRVARPFSGDWKREKFLDLLANRDTFERLQKGETADSIVRSWEKGLEEFRKRRAKYLMY
jgi:hypothetical protein